jgi:hypothetical protein
VASLLSKNSFNTFKSSKLLFTSLKASTISFTPAISFNSFSAFLLSFQKSLFCVCSCFSSISCCFLSMSKTPPQILNSLLKIFNHFFICHNLSIPLFMYILIFYFIFTFLPKFKRSFSFCFT